MVVTAPLLEQSCAVLAPLRQIWVELLCECLIPRWAVRASLVVTADLLVHLVVVLLVLVLHAVQLLLALVLRAVQLIVGSRAVPKVRATICPPTLVMRTRHQFPLAVAPQRQAAVVVSNARLRPPVAPLVL